MSTDHFTIAATRVVNLTQGADLPDAIIDAFNYREAVYAISLEGPDITAALVATNLDTVAQVVTELASARSLKTEMNTVVQEARLLADRKLVGAVTAGAEQIIINLEPKFKKAAAAFTKAFEPLTNISYRDTDALVSAGSESVRNLEAAIKATAPLNDLRAIRNELANLGVVASGNRQHEIGTRFCDVTDTLGAEQAAHAIKAHGPIEPWGALLSLDKVTGLTWRTTWAHTGYLNKLPQREIRAVSIGGGAYQHQEVAAR